MVRTCQSGRIGADSGYYQFKKYSEWFGHDLAYQSGRAGADLGFCQFKNILNGSDMIRHASQVE
jgi:hypothetical protein